MSTGFAGRHVVGLVDLSIHVCLEIQNERYIEMLYLIDHIAYGFYVCYRFYILKGNQPKTNFPTSWPSDKTSLCIDKRLWRTCIEKGRSM